VSETPVFKLWQTVKNDFLALTIRGKKSQLQVKSIQVSEKYRRYIHIHEYTGLATQICLHLRLVLSTYHELIPARNAIFAAMHGSSSGSNICYYPT
jgi:hypothetical protein